MQPLTIAFVTSRRAPRFEWFVASLFNQLGKEEAVDVILVDTYAHEGLRALAYVAKFIELFGDRQNVTFRHVWPKPTIWQGKHRITKEDWWAKSNAINTAICLARHPWFATVDDRSVLGPHWLEAVNDAMKGTYAVCGSYEKHRGLEVKDGVVVRSAELLGADTRTPGIYNFDSWYGGSGALPLEWCLMVQGFSEDLADGLGSEDSQFGSCLKNNNLPIKYDSRMRLIEDRTPGQIDGALKRADKNAHLGQQAKSWDIVRAFKHAKTSQNSFDIRNLRDRVLLNGESLDSIMPSASHQDWYDQTEIKDFE